MDQRRFDRIARLLGGATTRRVGLRAAFGAALGLAAVEPAADAGANAARRRVPEGGPWPAGPCGPKGADNRCKKDKDCCTGYCAGTRCRCIHRGKPCTSSQTCCGGAACANGVCPRRPRCVKPGKPCAGKDTCCRGLTCIKGTCGESGVPTSQPCVAANDTCADVAASCIAYDSDDPAGTYCLLPTGAACTGNADCYSQDCASGTCAAVTCDVCSSGCPYADLDAAIAGTADGGRIRIDAGTWISPTTSLLPKSLRFEACGGVPGVIITPFTPSGCGFDITDNQSITAKNLEFTATGTYYPICANSVSSAAAKASMTVMGCTFSSTSNVFGMGAYGPTDMTVTDSTFDGTGVEALVTSPGAACVFDFTRCTFKNLTSIYSFNLEDDIDLTLTDCLIDNNDSSVGPAISASGRTSGSTCSVTLAGTTTLSNNSASQSCGAVWLGTTNGAVTFTMTDQTVITGNTAPQASGLGVWKETGPVTVTGTSGRITGNTGAPDQCAVSTNSGVSWTSVPDCTSF